MPLSNIEIGATHDGYFHEQRTLYTVDSMELGINPPFINPKICNGMGYGINLFYQPLVTYVPIFINLFAQNMALALKIFGALMIILSGLTMYAFVREVTKSKKIAFIAGVLYMIAPYKLSDVYVRFAIGEFTALAFVPVVFQGMYNLFKGDGTRHYLISVGAIGLLLSHTISTLYMVIFCIIFMLLNIKKLKSLRIWKYLIINLVFAALVACFAEVPSFESEANTEYTIFDDGSMKTYPEWMQDHGIEFKQLVMNNDRETGLVFIIGTPTLLLLAFTIISAKKVDKKYFKIYLCFFIGAIIMYFMASKYCPWFLLPKVLSKLQYPWRLIGFANFFIAFVAAVNFDIVLNRFTKKEFLKNIIAYIFIILSIWHSMAVIYNDFTMKDNNKDSSILNTISKGNTVSHMAINRDYLPLKAIKKQTTYMANRKDEIVVLEGNTNITKFEKKDLNLYAEFEDIEANTIIELPFIYYIHYEAVIVDGNGNEELAKIEESNNGYVSIKFEKPYLKASIRFYYKPTTLSVVSYIVSGISFIAYIAYIIFEIVKNRRNMNKEKNKKSPKNNNDGDSKESKIKDSKFKEWLKKEKVRAALIIVALSFATCLLLFLPNQTLQYDDGVHHIARLIGTENSIKEGQIIPNIISNQANGYGYSWNIFYSPITGYVPLIFRLIGANFTLCIKLFIFAVTIATGWFMYKFVYEITKNNKIAILASVLYIFWPYRLTDIYNRMALAEITTFMFLPLVFHGIYNVFNDKDKNYKTYETRLMFGTAGLILTQPVIAMYTGILAFIFVIINIKKLKDIRVFRRLLASIVIALVITSFYWLPLIMTKNAAQYEVFVPGRMLVYDWIVSLKVQPLQLLYTETGPRVYELGIVTIFGLLLTVFAMKKYVKTEENNLIKKYYIFALISGIVLLIMSLTIFPFEKLPAIFTMLQFSFRLLEFVGFFFSFVVAYNIVKMLKNISKFDFIIVIALIVLFAANTIGYIRYDKATATEEQLSNGVKITENSGRVVAGEASLEYLPSKAFSHLDYLWKERSSNIVVLDGDVSVKNAVKNGHMMEAEISVQSEDAVIELPYIFYPGYSVKINDRIEPIFEDDNGFVAVKVWKSELLDIKVAYTGTSAMHYTRLISVIALILIILYELHWRRICDTINALEESN